MKLLVTSALRYASSRMHIGNILGSFFPADIFSRANRFLGKEVVYLSGSDQFGFTTFKSALLQNKSPAYMTEKVHIQNHNLLRKLNISLDIFSKTNTREHKEYVRKIYLLLKKKKKIYSVLENYYYCKKCSFFVLRKESENEDNSSTICFKCSENLFIKKKRTLFLKINEKKVKKFISNSVMIRDIWLPSLNYFLKDLKNRSFTRYFSWGIPLPSSYKKFYVWFEALLGYFSFNKSSYTESHYFYGKDNFYFHAILLPAIFSHLPTSERPYSPKRKAPFFVQHPQFHLILDKNEKISKSQKNIRIDLDILLKTEHKDIIRYSLGRIDLSSSDTIFDSSTFKASKKTFFNNVINTNVRFLTLIKNFFSGKIFVFKGKPSLVKKSFKKILSSRKEVLEEVEGKFYSISKVIQEKQLWKIKTKRIYNNLILDLIHANTILQIWCREIAKSYLDYIGVPLTPQKKYTFLIENKIIRKYANIAQK